MAMDPDYDLSVPGTNVILDEAAEAAGDNFTLVPAPSTSPDDPLNWSKGRKWLQLSCIVAYVLAVCFNAGCMYPIYGALSDTTGLSLDQINTGVGYFYLLEGFGALFTLPLTIAIGKRPVYIASCLAAAIYPFALSSVRTNGQFVGLCVVNGFSLSPLFTAPEASLSDVFFYHERALPFGIYVAATYGGAVLAPIFSGYIFNRFGLRGPPFFAGGFCILISIVLFVLLEETNFKRDQAATTVVNHDVPALSGDVAHSDEHDEKLGHGHDEKAHDSTAEAPKSSVVEVGGLDTKPSQHVQVGVHSYDRIVSPWPGPRPWKMFTVSPYAGGILLRGFIQPVLMLRLPIILWCGVLFGLYQVFFNVMAALSSGVLGEAPYNLAPTSVGLTFISPALAIIPGAIFGGWLSDWYTVRQARKNGGVSEAEHKLKLIVIPTILAPFGLLMIGLGPYYGAHWMVFVAGEFVLTVAGPLATLLSLTYAFDSFHTIHPREKEGPRREVQAAAPYLLSLVLFAMCMTFGFNYVITPWAFTWGFKNFAISAVCIATAINVSAFVMYRYGKKLRRSGASYYAWVINW